jgi:hypothetical protein
LIKCDLYVDRDLKILKKCGSSLLASTFLTIFAGILKVYTNSGIFCPEIEFCKFRMFEIVMGFSTSEIFDWKCQADDTLKLVRQIVR